ncbi:zinc finger BED domain-containing protein 4-like [Tachysurus ichikawai]
MLNAREPKVVNGPEILKYVGESEANIRKLFADAEEEQKRLGANSGLHIIIFDELDAICKQRGTGASSTGVHNTVVNQLLSKIDSVDQLNNILVIGMTNRPDLIDDALMRPGRFEVKMEIGLPDEKGRVQILSIHTAKMREFKLLADDVDLKKLAAETKNYSGAELEGLVRAAQSTAMNRHIKKSLTLATMPLDERHTGVNIATWLEEVVTKFNISVDNIKAVVHDNGSNVVAALKLLAEKHNWVSVRCTGHTLQLVVNNSLKETSISKALGAARTLVEHFRRSELANTKLKEKQQQMNTAEHRLIQDVTTRWNSTYFMLERLLEQRWPITATLSDPEVTPRGKHYFDLKPDQWSLLEELTQGLQLFQCSTEFLSGQEYTTLSCLPQLAKGLQRSVTQSLNFETTPEKAFLAKASRELIERGLRFRALLKSLLLKQEKSSGNLQKEGSFSVTVPRREEESVLENLLQSDTDSLSEEESSHEEQKIQMMARSFLCIPATSTPSERIFSAAGNICSQKRASLSREHVDMLTFLHFNTALI